MGAETLQEVDQARALAALRNYALKYTDRLPDFVCTQITPRAFKANAGHCPGQEGGVFLLFACRRREVTVWWSRSAPVISFRANKFERYV